MNGFLSTLRSLNRQVWLQAVGRLFCQMGFGLISFYIPILFVNRIGLSATAVGLSLSLSAVTEVGAHLMGGVLADSPKFGRKLALSLSALLGIALSVLLAINDSLITLIIASLFLGLSLGFYWTSSSAAVMDATDSEERHRAFAVMGVAEYVGIGIGVLGGSAVLAFVHQSTALLFAGCGLVFLIFLILVQVGMVEKQPSSAERENLVQGIAIALKDRLLLLFVLANVFFATYVALVSSIVPLYFTNFVAGSDSVPGVSVTSTANLFTWCYIGIGAVAQLPITQVLSGLSRVRVLMLAMVLWAGGFSLLWVAGTFVAAQFLWGVIGLGLMAIASVTYKPFSVAIVSDLAPESLRGTYTAVSSQSWTMGYFIGPIMGGWAMDQPPTVAHVFWLAIAASTLGCIAVLWTFETLAPEAVVQATDA